ncbi:MAG: CpsB/CapC family capsule biosynthesis tyrosine phosphatase [Desulfobacterales bacterium]
MTTRSMPLPMRLTVTAISCCRRRPQTMEESLEMARIAADEGIDRIIATPHVTDVGPSPKKATRVDEFNLLLQEKTIPVQVFPGAEAASGLTPGLFSRHTLNRASYVLIEFPMIICPHLQKIFSSG